MSELGARGFLRALYHAARGTLRHPAGHQALEDAVSALERAAQGLTATTGEAVLSVGEHAFYLGSSMLPCASLEFRSMLRNLRQQGIDTITLTQGARRRDLAQLAALVSGRVGDVPPGGTVRLNEGLPTPEGPQNRPLSGLHLTYAASLDALRDVGRGYPLDMRGVVGLVEGFLRGAPEPGPSLMMASMRNLDEAVYYHSVNVCLLALALGRAIGLEFAALHRLGVGAMLHDIGRVVLDDPALYLPGPLSKEEWAVVRLHPQQGALTILAAAGPGEECAATVALEHHVRLDGGGYPDLGGRRPHLFSRLVSIVDAYEAVTGPRPHRPARTPREALRILDEGAGSAYDADLVRAFMHLMGAYPPGSLLRLDGGEVVMVAAGAGGHRRALMVRDGAGSLLEVPPPIDLEGRCVTAQLLADDLGVDCTAVLEAAEASTPTAG